MGEPKTPFSVRVNLCVLPFFKAGFGIVLFASTEDFGGQILTLFYYLHFLPGVLVQ